MTSIPPVCHLCQGPLNEVAAFARLPQVTSDCRLWHEGGRLAVCQKCATVQKVVDDLWGHQVAEIYNQYRIYYQSSGAEQKILANDSLVPRSEHLLHQILDYLRPPEVGRMLDMGCGNGGLLRSFSRIMPKWSLSGLDLSDIERDNVVRIPGVEAFYTGNIDEVAGAFDMIFLLHTLEHIPEPNLVLCKLRQKLAAQGAMIFQVPNYRQNPFDLLIADHATHFSVDTLSSVLINAGLAVGTMADGWVRKEITVVARPGTVAAMPAVDCAKTVSEVETCIQWLSDVKTQAMDLARSKPIAVFGTSIAATWLFGQMPDQVALFVDEDPSRIGRTHMDRPILAPQEIPEGMTVYLPLAPVIAEHLAMRLGQQGRQYVAPPCLSYGPDQG